MRSGIESLRGIGVLTGSVVMFAMVVTSAYSQDALTTENMVNQLAGPDAASDLDVAALRQQTLDRIKSKADGVPLKRPPVARGLLKLPHFNVDVQFNPDSPIIRPESYRTLGRIADALYDPALSSYGFLIVGHTEATGRRENNLTLSQRRAESIRGVLVTTFKVSPKRIQAIGLGEEQLQDSAHPAAAVNRQIEIVAFRKAP
jgi:outer membrane protein OmpA-like peptidoglycan-associated protein